MVYDINYLAVSVAAVVSMGLGALWYSPMLFGKQWMALSGLSSEKMDAMKAKGMTTGYAIGFVGSLVMAYVLAHFVQIAGATDISGALQLGFWVWLGFVATVMLGAVLWEGKSWNLYFLNAGYHLVSLLIMSSILTLWV